MPNGLPDAGGTHTEQESHSWTIEIPDHEKRTEGDYHPHAEAVHRGRGNVGAPG